MCICGSSVDVLPFAAVANLPGSPAPLPPMPEATLVAREGAGRFLPGSARHVVRFEGISVDVALSAHLRLIRMTENYLPLTVELAQEDGERQIRQIFLDKQELLTRLGTTLEGQAFLSAYTNPQQFTLKERDVLHAQRLSSISAQWSEIRGFSLKEAQIAMRIAQEQLSISDPLHPTSIVAGASPRRHRGVRPPRDLLVDKRAGDAYLLMNHLFDRHLGSGGTKSAYNAISCTHPERELAVVIGRKRHGHVQRQWEQIKRELKREGDYMQSLSSQCTDIVSLHCMHEEISAVYLLMDRYIGDLYSVVQAEPSMEDGKKLGFTCSITNAVAYMHSVDVLHRDIKLENVLVTRDGKAKLSDFGSACGANDYAGLRESFAATYTAPEQSYPDYFATKASDCWSLGVALYILFQRSMENVVEGATTKDYDRNVRSFDTYPEQAQRYIDQRIAGSGIANEWYPLLRPLLRVVSFQRANAAYVSNRAQLISRAREQGHVSQDGQPMLMPAVAEVLAETALPPPVGGDAALVLERPSSVRTISPILRAASEPHVLEQGEEGIDPRGTVIS